MSQTPHQISEPSSPVAMTAPPAALAPLPEHVVQHYSAAQEPAAAGPCMSEDEENHGGTFVNIHGVERSYLELNSGALQSLYDNNIVEQNEIQEHLADCDPWPAIVKMRAEPVLSVEQVQAINLAQSVTRSLEEMSPAGRMCVNEILDKILYYFHKGPRALAAAQATLREIEDAQEQVMTEEAARAVTNKRARLQERRQKAHREAVTNRGSRVRSRSMR